jgi:hypothetical protein
MYTLWAYRFKLTALPLGSLGEAIFSCEFHSIAIAVDSFIELNNRVANAALFVSFVEKQVGNFTEIGRDYNHHHAQAYYYHQKNSFHIRWLY